MGVYEVYGGVWGCVASRDQTTKTSLPKMNKCVDCFRFTVPSLSGHWGRAQGRAQGRLLQTASGAIKR